MPEFKGSPFRRTRALQRQIDEYLDKVVEGALIFEQSVVHYLDAGYDEIIDQRYEKLSAAENRGDELRRSIELVMYAEMLIPEARGDVLALLDNLDDLLGIMKKFVLGLAIEQPPIPEEIRDDLKPLIAAVVRCIESVVLAARAYFRDPRAVRDHIVKIGFHESEADHAAIRCRRKITKLDLPLERRLLIRDGVIALDQIADDAEDVGDRLAIYAVKRSL